MASSPSLASCLQNPTLEGKSLNNKQYSLRKTIIISALWLFGKSWVQIAKTVLPAILSSMKPLRCWNAGRDTALPFRGQIISTPHSHLSCSAIDNLIGFFLYDIKNVAWVPTFFLSVQLDGDLFGSQPDCEHRHLSRALYCACLMSLIWPCNRKEVIGERCYLPIGSD